MMNQKRTTIPSSRLQQQVGTVLRRVAVDGEHLIVERNGFPVVAILPVAEYERLMRKSKRKMGK